VFIIFSFLIKFKSEIEEILIPAKTDASNKFGACCICSRVI
jgi:hypothetical protein